MVREGKGHLQEVKGADSFDATAWQPATVLPSSPLTACHPSPPLPAALRTPDSEPALEGIFRAVPESQRAGQHGRGCGGHQDRALGGQPLSGGGAVSGSV